MSIACAVSIIRRFARPATGMLKIKGGMTMNKSAILHDGCDVEYAIFCDKVSGVWFCDHRGAPSVNYATRDELMGDIMGDRVSWLITAGINGGMPENKVLTD